MAEALTNDGGLFIEAERNRKSEHEILIGEADGDDATIAPTDNVRVKIGRAGETPQLEVQSDSATAAGSQCTAANPTVLTLAAGDLAFASGIYDIEAMIVDASDSDAPKSAERGIFVLKETMGGVVT